MLRCGRVISTQQRNEYAQIRQTPSSIAPRPAALRNSVPFSLLLVREQSIISCFAHTFVFGVHQIQIGTDSSIKKPHCAFGRDAAWIQNTCPNAIPSPRRTHRVPRTARIYIPFYIVRVYSMSTFVWFILTRTQIFDYTFLRNGPNTADTRPDGETSEFPNRKFLRVLFGADPLVWRLNMKLGRRKQTEMSNCTVVQTQTSSRKHTHHRSYISKMVAEMFNASSCACVPSTTVTTLNISTFYIDACSTCIVNTLRCI